jgi:hypothetical protein
MKKIGAAFLFALVTVLSPDQALAAPKETAREETLILFGQRRVTLTVPAGFRYSSGKNERGLITTKLTDSAETIVLQISFLPDESGEFVSSRGRKEFMVETFQPYVGGSVEKAMQFEELEPRSGGGTYCVFTDANLVGKTNFPPGEFLNSTTGVKSWRGCIAVFTLLSNNTTSEEYRTAILLLRESLSEPPLTPLR